MPTLNDPEAIELLDRLRELLVLADETFKDEAAFEYPEELGEITDIVEQLQPFASRKKEVRSPFWKCVTHLDSRKKLGVAVTLTEMVDRATRIPPGPLVK